MEVIKTNCFAYDSAKGKCKACKDLKCAKCAFYKTKNQSKNFIPKPFDKTLSGYGVADVVYLFSKN